MKNLRRWSKWQSMPHKEKMLHEEFQLISIYASNAGIPKCFIDHAKAMYKDLYEQKNFRGMKRDAIRAACIWIACWQNGCPRTSNEIADIFHIDKNNASLGCSSAEELLQSHERNMNSADKLQFCALTPSSFIERFSSRLDLSQEQSLLAKFIAIKVEKKQLKKYRKIMRNADSLASSGRKEEAGAEGGRSLPREQRGAWEASSQQVGLPAGRPWSSTRQPCPGPAPRQHHRRT